MSVLSCLPEGTDPEIVTIVEACYANPLLHAKMMFPELFSTDFNSLHKLAAKALFHRKKQKVQLRAPRGFGKTTWIQFRIARKILFRECHFIVYCGESSPHATMQTENVKGFLRSNRFIREYFGDIKVTDYQELGLDTESFGKQVWCAFGDVLILPRGKGQQVRGLNWRGYRPDYLVFDDIENRMEIQNEENRKKDKAWFYSDVEKCVSRYDKNWEMDYIDTLKDPDALTLHLEKQSDWDTVSLSVCDDNLKSLAPEYMTDAEVREEYDRHVAAGMEDVFFREYRNIAQAPDYAVFKQEYFQHYSPGEFPPAFWRHCDTVVIVDPSKSANPRSDPSGFTVVSFDYQHQRIFIRKSFGKNLHIEEMYKTAFDLCDEYGAKIIAVEVTSLKEFITVPFQSEIMRLGKELEFVELEARGVNKALRIKGLRPFYKLSLVYHHPKDCVELEQQLVRFPGSGRDDVMDSAAYMIPLLEASGQFLMPSPETVRQIQKNNLENNTPLSKEEEYNDFLYEQLFIDEGEYTYRDVEDYQGVI